MKNVSIIRAARPRRGLISGAMVCLLLSGCMGQKSNLPSFSWKQSSDSAEKVDAGTESTTPVASKDDLMHVALNDPAALGPGGDLGESDILQASGEAVEGKQNATHAGGEEVDWDEIDKAFQSQGGSETPAPVEEESLEEFEDVIASVDGGDSHLEALKKSLDEINLREQTNDVGSVYLGEVNGAATDGEQAIPTAAGPEEMTLAAATSTAPTAEPFPGTETTPTETAAQDGPIEKARLLITRSRTLIQENNLRAAASVAQSAQSMLQKTQSALSPGEVTPEQVLADIAARQAAHEKRLAEQAQLAAAELEALATTEKQTASTQKPVPVVIDLSRDWINSDQGKDSSTPDDVESFAEATVRANRPAALPTITPRGATVPNSDPLRVSEAESDVLQAPPAEDTLAVPSDISDVVLLGEMPADDDDAPFVLSGDSQPDDEAPTYQPSSAPPLSLGSAESGPSLGGSSAPLLMAPGGSSADLGEEDVEIDEFAADFANVTETAPPTLDEAPLLIDETELHDEPKQADRSSRMNMLLIAGGIVAGLLLFSRWKR